MFGVRTILVLLLVSAVWCRSNGPPLPQACQNQLVPQHMGTASQTGDDPPFFIEVNSSYVAGATLTGWLVHQFLLLHTVIKIINSEN